MLKITDNIKYTPRTPSSAQRMSKKLRKAYLRRLRSKEYLRLKNIIPTVAKKKKVDKVTVVEEAIRYIDHLHEVLSKKLQQIGMSQNGEQSSILNMVKLMAASGVSPSGGMLAPSAAMLASIKPCNNVYCKKLNEQRRKT